MIKDNHGYNQYTKEEIIELAQNWFNEHGRLVQRDLKHANGLPSYSIENSYRMKKCWKIIRSSLKIT